MEGKKIFDDEKKIATKFLFYIQKIKNWIFIVTFHNNDLYS